MKTKQQLLDEAKALEEKLAKKKEEIAKIEEKERKVLEGDILQAVFAWQDEQKIANDDLLKKLCSKLSEKKVRAKKTQPPAKEEKAETKTEEKAEVKKEVKKEPAKESAKTPRSAKAKIKALVPGLSEEDTAPFIEAIRKSDNNIVVDMQLRFFLKEKAEQYKQAAIDNFDALKQLIKS